MTIALGALRILARQKSGCGPIVSDDGLHTLAGLSWLDSDNSGRISGGGVADHQLRGRHIPQTHTTVNSGAL